jgi:hypothetical protein
VSTYSKPGSSDHKFEATYLEHTHKKRREKQEQHRTCLENRKQEMYRSPDMVLSVWNTVFTFDMLPLLPPFPMGKTVSGYRGKAAVPVETAFPPVFNMTGAFNRGLSDPLPLRGVRITIQQPVVKTPDDPVLGYPDSLKGIAPGVPAYIVRLVRFDVVRLG